MNGLTTVAATVCACCVIIALLSHFAGDGGTKRLVGLVMGAFMLCAAAIPTIRAVSDIRGDWQSMIPAEESATADEAFNREVLQETKRNLETALTDILAQNGYAVKGAEITPAIAEENRVVIAAVTVTVGEEYADEQAEIAALVEKHFAVKPRIQVE